MNGKMTMYASAIEERISRSVLLVQEVCGETSSNWFSIFEIRSLHSIAMQHQLKHYHCDWRANVEIGSASLGVAKELVRIGFHYLRFGQQDQSQWSVLSFRRINLLRIISRWEKLSHFVRIAGGIIRPRWMSPSFDGANILIAVIVRSRINFRS